jgi:uncharacterized membrane protein YgdD (TMEM256/DUF423 family)
MSEIQPGAYEPHPLHTLVSWPAVFAGAVTAVAVGAMLNLLGVALGAAAMNPFDMTRGDAEAFSAGAGAWVAIANALALFVGGFVASRSAKYADHHKGILHGITVWAIAFLVAILVATSTAAAGITNVLGGAAESADVADDPYYVADALLPEAAPPGTDAAPAVPPPVQREAEQAADTTGTMALWAFLTMLLGAVGAIAGARYGTKRHAWETKAHVSDGPTIHTTPI